MNRLKSMIIGIWNNPSGGIRSHNDPLNIVNDHSRGVENLLNRPRSHPSSKPPCVSDSELRRR